MKNKKLELLAPAQNIECAYAAVTFGADAVYIGANSFGARKTAKNSIKDIEEVVDFAHKFAVKIYVTVNTIIKDTELKEAQKLIYKLYEIGVDAVIIQDMGLLEIDLPDIELHASTQCNIRTIQKAQFLQKAGFKRIILARELSLAQIKEISDNVNIEIETFIHGALCVCYSGQCYMSAYIGGRSANRGECAQACRQKYSLILNNKTIVQDKYLLSMKDFCAEKYIDKLVQSGVTSFKIEGRLKDERYVRNVVLYYRCILDKYKKTSAGIIYPDFNPDINKTFNRGYTTYFLDKQNEIFNFETQKATGEFIGNVIKTGKNWFEIETDKTLHPQDGLYTLKGGFLINRIDNAKIYPGRPQNLSAGDKVYRNKDIYFENIIKNSKTKRLISVDIEIYNDRITASDNDFFVELPYFANETAKNQEKMKENFNLAFKKTGDGIFKAEKILFKTDNLPFLPISSINSIRREIFSKLENKRLNEYKAVSLGAYSPAGDIKKLRQFAGNYPKYTEKADYRLNIANKKALEFYKKCSVECEMAPEISGNFKGIELMRTKHCLRRALGLCLKMNNKKGIMLLINKNNDRFPLEFDCVKCEMIVKSPI